MRVDISEVRSLTRAAHKEFGDIQRVMLAAVEKSAADERANHKWSNRSYELEKNTLGEAWSTGPITVARLKMDTPYASFVRDRRFSAIAKRAQQADRRISRHFDRMASRLSKL